MALVLAAGDLIFKAVAEHNLNGERSVHLGVLDLRLGYNSGAAFNLGAGLPTWVVLAVTSVITVGVAVFAWRSAATASWPVLIGLAMVLAGAVGNLADRAGDGLVTDYLHTGWWPTFNLADVFITLGAITVALAVLREDMSHRRGR
ncbi:signal peptidase II [Blastococcus sp. TF02A-26]|uniref:signal peptidase II n=1 Tax=Blastococcus sp. TF02A-26 TaxID=2250577 RepID=UPI001F175F4B|nr:signal peptidase II [Blastococcus sp. TF02A-26]